MDVYAIGSKSGLSITKGLKYCFHECGSPINICSDNVQEEFMGSVHKILCTYEVVSNKSEAHKQNHNHAEWRIK